MIALDHDAHHMGILEKETQGTHIAAIVCDITRPIPIDPESVDLVYISTVIHGFSRQQLEFFLG